jgi:hypothetical protein
MNYLIAVLPDRLQVEAAYVALEKQGFPMDRVTILGRGYKSADEFGLVDPKRQAIQQARLMSYWLVPFGFVAGVTFSLMTNLHTFAWAGDIGDRAIAGLLGAVSGGLGSLLAGGGAGLVTGSGDALPDRNRLDAGKYLLVVRDSDNLTQQAAQIVRQFAPESIQGYVVN